MVKQKLPAIQFYPGDWRKDVGVQSLSFHDRGVWFEMLMLMHESERRGLLILNGQPMSEETLSRLLGLNKQILTKTVARLLSTGVAGRDEETGALMCRRMVRDERIRQVRTEAGKKGGNPALLNLDSNQPAKQNPTPSVSSSVKLSSSTSPPGVIEDAIDFSQDTEPDIPDGLAITQYADFACRQAHIPAGYGLKVKVGDAINFLAQLEHCTQAKATALMVPRLIEAQKQGAKIHLWLDDGGWKTGAKDKYEAFMEAGK